MKGILLILSVTVLTLVLSGSIAYAETNNVTGYLINEPMSMMDWGIYNLKERIQNQVLKNAKKDNLANSLNDFLFVDAYFDIDKNQITIKVPSLATVIPKGNKDAVALSIEEAKQWSKRIIFAIKDNLGVDPKTGKPKWGDDNTFIYSTLFSHYGWSRKSLPTNIEKEIERLIVIQAESLVKTGKEKLTCFSNLRDEYVFCSEPIPFSD